MPERHSIKDGRTEAVMWIIYRDDHILIEHRPRDEQGASMCIPCGHIDLNRDTGNNYIANAFLRECHEELAIRPTDYQFLTTIDFDEQDSQGNIDHLRLHYFLVSDWDGTIPDYTMEDGEKHAKLEWMDMEETGTLPQSCDREAIEHLPTTK